jgi:secondary thiamine-phosphate synthase enzyme
VDKSLRATSIMSVVKRSRSTRAIRVEIIDLTDRLMSIVHDRTRAGRAVSVFSLHTTCAVFINEVQTALIADIKGFLERLVPRDGPWIHNDTAHSDCDRQNADAHLRALLLGSQRHAAGQRRRTGAGAVGSVC